MKPGPKAWETRTRAAVMPLPVVAQRLGVSLRTVATDWKSAIAKLRRTPGAFELILAVVEAAAEESLDLMQCGSVECSRRFIETYGESERPRTKKKCARGRR